MELIQVIESVFQDPPIPYQPEQHSLKAWAMYCLRNRGFKLVYAEKADFAIERRGQNQRYFNVVLMLPEERDQTLGWIVWNCETQSARVIAP